MWVVYEFGCFFADTFVSHLWPTYGLLSFGFVLIAPECVTAFVRWLEEHSVIATVSVTAVVTLASSVMSVTHA
jgi:hypothetical protein